MRAWLDISAFAGEYSFALPIAAVAKITAESKNHDTDQSDMTC